MAEADKDGRVAQMVSDMHTTLGMSLHENAREMRVAVIKALVESASEGDDGPCHACAQHYPTWRAPDDLWNPVLGGTRAKDDPGGMLCPNCFLRLAGLVAPISGAWVVGTPVRLERVVAAEALREAADAIDADDDVALNHILGGASYTTYWLRDRATAIENGDRP